MEDYIEFIKRNIAIIFMISSSLFVTAIFVCLAMLQICCGNETIEAIMAIFGIFAMSMDIMTMVKIGEKLESYQHNVRNGVE